jgi:hypothetical protein
MATPKTPVLNLDTLIVREHITIDGQPYELRNADEFSVVDAHRLGRKGVRLDQLMTSAELTPDEEMELAGLLDALCKSVLDAPEAVHKTLRDAQRSAIFQAFTELSLPLSPQTRAHPRATTPVIGARPPLASRGSTGARRKAG